MLISAIGGPLNSDKRGLNGYNSLLTRPSPLTPLVSIDPRLRTHALVEIFESGKPLVSHVTQKQLFNAIFSDVSTTFGNFSPRLLKNAYQKKTIFLPRMKEVCYCNSFFMEINEV